MSGHWSVSGLFVKQKTAYEMRISDWSSYVCFSDLLADKGYDGDRFRENLLLRGILPVIPPRTNRKVPAHPDYRRYKDRNRIERMFGKLKQQRRIATRYDKTVLSFESFLNLAAARLWLKSFVHAA